MMMSVITIQDFTKLFLSFISVGFLCAFLFILVGLAITGLMKIFNKV